MHKNIFRAALFGALLTPLGALGQVIPSPIVATGAAGTSDEHAATNHFVASAVAAEAALARTAESTSRMAAPAAVNRRVPNALDDSTHNHAVGDLWLAPGGVTYQATRVTPTGKAVWSLMPSVALPCDAVATIACYGTKLMRAAYAGNALQITRSSDSTTLAIPFLTNGNMNVALGDAFCANTTCGVTIWYDQGASTTNNATVALANAPAWNGANTIFGTRAVSFNSSAHGLTNLTAVAKYMTLPASLTWNYGTTAWFLAGQELVDREQRNWIMGSTGIGWGTYADRMSNIGLGFSCPMASDNGPAVDAFAFISGATAGCWSNDNSVTLSYGNSTAQTGGTIGTATTGSALNYDAVGIVAVASPTIALVTTERQALSQAYAIPMQQESTVLLLGDSTSMGTASTYDTAIWNLALPALNQPVRLYNAALFGATLNYISTTSTQSYYYNPNAKSFVVVLFAGANDVRGAVSLATIQGYVQTIVSYWRSKGSNVSILLATEPVQCDVSNNSTQLAAEQAFNNWLISSYNVAQGSGGAGADGLINFFADPTMGPGVYTAGVSNFCSNTSFSPDGQHVTFAGEQYFVPIAASALNAFLP